MTMKADRCNCRMKLAPLPMATNTCRMAISSECKEERGKERERNGIEQMNEIKAKKSVNNAILTMQFSLRHYPLTLFNMSINWGLSYYCCAFKLIDVVLELNVRMFYL